MPRNVLYRFEKNPRKDVRDTEVNRQTHRQTKNQTNRLLGATAHGNLQKQIEIAWKGPEHCNTHKRQSDTLRKRNKIPKKGTQIWKTPHTKIQWQKKIAKNF